MDVNIGKKVFIRNSGKDEYWLQELIYDNPSILGLGDLIPASKEKKQSTGGRLDILLKDPIDNSMYEVEVMLGETDPSHIIRAIEYWDIEKRRYPQRQHYSVLVAESFDRRYFNVVQIMSLNIPMIAIQANLLELPNLEKILTFTKVMDVYEEPEEEADTPVVNESKWNDTAPWTLAVSKEFNALLSELDSYTFKYTQSYISLVKNGRNIYNFAKKATPKSYMWFRCKDSEKVDAIKKIYENSNIDYTFDKSENFTITVDKDFIKKNRDVFTQVHKIQYFEGQKEIDE